MKYENRPVTGRPAFVLNQKAPVFADRRTRRVRDRSAQRRQAITVSQS